MSTSRDALLCNLVCSSQDSLSPANGVAAELDKVKAVREWPEPKSISNVRSFHGLATFYRRFIKGFGTIIAPITNCLKKGEFKWTTAAFRPFTEIKQKMQKLPF